MLRDAFAFKFAWATSDRSAFSGFHVSNERSVTDIAQRVKLVSVEHKGDKRGRALSHGWPCNPIGNLRRVSLCTRRYHGTRPRASLSRVRTGTRTRASLSCARVWMRFQHASNAPCPNTTTTMALFLRQVSRSCWKNREDDRLPSGIRAPLFFFSLFLFFLSVAPVTRSSSPLLKRFGKNPSNFFSWKIEADISLRF